MKQAIIILLAVAALGSAHAQMADKIKPVGAWSTFMGCTTACSHYHGLKHSPAWICGVTGYAFLLNMHPAVCPSGPTAFDNNFLKQNAQNLGLSFETISFSKDDKDFQKKQKNAWEKVGQALRQGIPVFGWELGMPDYYLLAGTDKDGYLYFDYDGSVKPCRWDKVGTSDIGMAEFLLVSRLEETPGTEQQVRESFKFFTEYQTDPSRFALPGYTQGPAGYDIWIKALQKGEYDSLGVAYNAHVWAEARTYAMLFLQEIPGLLGDKLDYAPLAQASELYNQAADALRQVCELYPFPPRPESFTPETASQAAELLTKARDSELEAVKHLLAFAEKF